ncbi:hypothetical protein BZG78_14560 [Salinivibrio sp. MA351]|jgi:hypothetical protein|uniref:Uncharacterized protein n=2 Tax=Vibrionaceae TaxID=641 RepID=A0ABX3KSY7_SALCS|nr:hypothetical protein BZG75_12235 [Salinivibrio sp. AR640]OOE92330.1 hypothetical protein BZG76_07220 [Salinivibrio sp. AR647]OOE96136.1 hypothetical protein BZG78_14560 [Salinivibrio sp. MA351]OOF00100.1 hypothetical protein BZG77_01280 [Salinivibrio sp. IB643]OOF04966.1 hypothetical protein BZG81_07455 [Salinivibrio sp. MA607]OOF06072.1 hypothetical protein BZG80_04465 [Salinivibrio sp. MA440]OOF34705.1 hypothetical protein BZJ21_04170 [Salinivibrio costicola subsp. alcaliphilus]
MVMTQRIGEFERKIQEAYQEGNIETAHRLEEQVALLRRRKLKPAADFKAASQVEDFHDVSDGDYYDS